MTRKNRRWCRRRNGSGRRRSGGRKKSKLGLFLANKAWCVGLGARWAGWADFSAPFLHITVDSNDFLLTCRVVGQAKFSSITTGRIGGIIRPAIQKDAVHSVCFEHCRGSRFGFCWYLAIQIAGFCMHGEGRRSREYEGPDLYRRLYGDIVNHECAQHWRSIASFFFF